MPGIRPCSKPSFRQRRGVATVDSISKLAPARQFGTSLQSSATVTTFRNTWDTLCWDAHVIRHRL